MSFQRIDPVPFPKIFETWAEEEKHLDNDERRHEMKYRVLKVEDYPGQEHLVCVPSQLNAEGRYRRPKKLIEAERRGFKSVFEMYEADKKEEEEKKASLLLEQDRKIAEQEKYIETLSVRSKGLEDHARQLEKEFADYRALADSRFDKLAMLVAGKNNLA